MTPDTAAIHRGWWTAPCLECGGHGWWRICSYRGLRLLQGRAKPLRWLQSAWIATRRRPCRFCDRTGRILAFPAGLPR